MKKIVGYPLERISLYDLEENLEKIIERMQEYIADYSGKYSNLRLVKEDGSGRYDPNPYDIYVLYGDALENDVLYEKRIKEESAQKNLTEEYERKQYEELKKKYGGN